MSTSILTIPDFAKRIKTKHPEYKDIPDADLAEKVLAKYPEYKTQVESPRQAVGRAFPQVFGMSTPTGYGQYLKGVTQQQIGEGVQDIAHLKETNPTEYGKRRALAASTAHVEPSLKYSAKVGATKDVPYNASRVVDNILNMLNVSNQTSPGGMLLRKAKGKEMDLNEIQKNSPSETAMFGGYREDVRKYLSQPNVQRALDNPDFWHNMARSAPNVAAQLVEIAALEPLAGPGAIFLQSFVQDYDLPVKEQIKAQITNATFLGAGKLGRSIAGGVIKGTGLGSRIARNLSVRGTQAGAGYVTSRLKGESVDQAESSAAFGFGLPAGTKGMGKARTVDAVPERPSNISGPPESKSFKGTPAVPEATEKALTGGSLVQSSPGTIDVSLKAAQEHLAALKSFAKSKSFKKESSYNQELITREIERLSTSTSPVDPIGPFDDVPQLTGKKTVPIITGKSGKSYYNGKAVRDTQTPDAFPAESTHDPLGPHNIERTSTKGPEDIITRVPTRPRKALTEPVPERQAPTTTPPPEGPLPEPSSSFITKGGSTAKPGQKGEISRDLIEAPWELGKKVATMIAGAKAAPKAEMAEALPAPGEGPSMKDLSAFESITSNVKTAYKVLNDHPATKSIAQALGRGQDLKRAYMGTYLRKAEAFTKGLDLDTSNRVGELLDTTGSPEAIMNKIGQTSPRYGDAYTSDQVGRASHLREIMDDIHSQFPPKSGPQGKNVGYIPAYLTHMESLLGDTDLQRGVAQIWDYHFKTPLERLRGAFIKPDLKGEGGGNFDRPTFDPSSPYVRHRQGKITNREYDVRRVIPAYIESSAKVLYDRPAVQNSKLLADALPKGSKLRDLATQSIRNVARYDAYPELDKAWTAVTSAAIKIYSRSVLGFNPVVAGYHAFRLFTDVWPAIESKYLAQGFKEFARHPIDTMNETARLGMIPSDIKPWSFKTFSEKGDAILQLGSIGDYFSRTVGFQSFLAKFKAEGMSEENATIKALSETKNTTQFVDQVRTQRLLMRQGPAGDLIHLLTQFKQQPTMIVEQYIDVLKNAKTDPAALLKLGTALGVGSAIVAGTGFKAIHLAPSIYTSIGGAAGEFLDTSRKLGAVWTDMSKSRTARASGDEDTADTYEANARKNLQQVVINLLKDITPGGWSVTRQIAHGKPGFLEADPKVSKVPTRPRRVETSLKDMIFK